MSISAVAPDAVEHEQALRIVGRVGRLDVGGPGDRLERIGQASIGVHRVAVRLDDVDGPGDRRGSVRTRDPSQDVHLLAGLVEDDPGARAGQRMAPEVGRPVLGAVAADRHDDVFGCGRVTGGHVQLRVVEAGDHRQAVGAAGQVDRVGHAAARAASTKVTPSAVATAIRFTSSIARPGSDPSAMASVTAVRMSPLPGLPRTTVGPD